MREPERKCGVCRALIDEEDLFCSNCGAEAPRADDEVDAAPLATRDATHNFTCRGCGASMSYDASAQTLRCPFCGGERLEKQPDTKTIGPSRVVPFTVDRAQAHQITREWLGQGFWRPSDLTEAAMVTKMAAVYVPYWVFRCRTHTYWTADTSDTPMGARGDWFPLAGEHRGSYNGVLVGASGALTPAETGTLCPFHLNAAVPPGDVDLQNFTIEQFRVPRKYARPLARSALEALERQACDDRYVPARSRNVHVNVLLDGLSSEAMLLPVWIMAYQYKGETFRFLINGQTGEPHGQKPFSYKKLALIIGAVILAIIAVLACMGIIGVLGANASTGEIERAMAQSSPRSPEAEALNCAALVPATVHPPTSHRRRPGAGRHRRSNQCCRSGRCDTPDRELLAGSARRHHRIHAMGCVGNQSMMDITPMRLQMGIHAREGTTHSDAPHDAPRHSAPASSLYRLAALESAPPHYLLAKVA